MGMPVNCGVSAVRVQGKRVVTLRLQRDWLCLGWLVMDAEVVEVTETDFCCLWPAAVAVAVAAGQGEAAPTVHRRQHRGREFLLTAGYHGCWWMGSIANWWLFG